MNVAALFTALDSYSAPYLNEMSITAGCTPHVLAVTTYFGNDIQGYVANDRTDMWQHPSDDAYWLGDDFERDLVEVANEWLLRILSASSSTG